MEARRHRAFATAMLALVVVFVLSVVPTPYVVVAPGAAVDLGTRIAVEGRVPARRRFYLTDVTIIRASVLLLLAALLPDARLLRRSAVEPGPGGPRAFDRMMDRAMESSQIVAAVVAERAAGYAVASPASTLTVESVPDWSHATATLRAGDELLAIGGRRLLARADVAPAIAAEPGGRRLAVRVRRAGATLELAVPPTRRAGHRLLGVTTGETLLGARLPVPVRFSMDDVSGSSGGLLFALDILATLRPDRSSAASAAARAGAVAGTGTLDLDGRVGAIEGVRQKLAAARRAGARTFLVPRENYAEIAAERGVRIVPVDTFADAVRAIGGG